MMHETPLPIGYHPLAPGHLANLVMCLEMTARPALRSVPDMPILSLARMGAGDTGRFRSLFTEVGRDMLWFSRLILSDEALAAIIGDPQVQSFALVREGLDVGLLELDFRTQGECELSFFGVVPSEVGKATGRWLMNEAITRAWSEPISRFWVHTCHFDHPKALAFYQRSGFRLYRLMVEVHEDPRVTGHLPRDAAPHVPLAQG